LFYCARTIKAELFADDKKCRYFHLSHSTALQHAQRSSLELELEKMENDVVPY
jgi:hypothetical protein